MPEVLFGPALFDLFHIDRELLGESLRSVVDLFLIPMYPNRRFITGNIVGRQAETMPADISIAVQPTVGVRV